MWDYWINEPVFLDGGVMNILKRKQAISIFVKEGLVPFIEKAGYRFHYTDVELVHVMLCLLYRLYEGKNVIAHERVEKNMLEHLWLYEYRLDSTAWARFWKTWGSSQDFEEGRFGECLRYKLQTFVWSWIDMDRSPASIQLERELEDQENQEEFSKGKEDPYLQDHSRRDYQDRHW
jgi:hypothetical protein